MRRSLVLLAAAGCCMLAAPALPAQDSAAALGVAASAAGGFVLGAGTDAVLRDGESATPSFIVHGGYEWAFGQSGLRLRLAGEYFSEQGGDYVVRSNGEELDRVENANRTYVYGGGLYLSYALSRGRVQPYLLGGLGLSHLMIQRDRLGSRITGPVQLERTSVALSGGLGIRARVGGAALFAEGRLTRFPAGRMVRGAMIPVVIGVRF